MRKIFLINLPKTFRSIFLYVAITTLVMIVIMTNLLYRNYEKIGLQTAYDYNIKYLEQISNNVSYLNDFITQYCLTQYSEPEIQKFLNSASIGDGTYFSYIRSIGKLQNTILISPMIHSVVVYNEFQDKVYSTSSIQGKNDEELNNMLKQNIKVDILKPIPRIISNNIYYRDRSAANDTIKLLTYLISGSDKNKVSSSAFAVNIDMSYLFANLNLEISRNGKGDSRLMLVNMDGTVFADESNAARPFEKLNVEYKENILKHGVAGSSFIERTNTGKKVVTCLINSNLNWILVNEQSYENVFYYIYQARNYTLFSTAMVGLVALIVAFIASHRIYNPINRLVYQIKRSLAENFETEKAENDMDYIQKVFEFSVQHINELEKYKMNTRDILKEYMIKTLIADNHTHAMKLSEEALDDISTLLSDKGERIIVLLKIDAFEKFIERVTEDRNLILFFISNSIRERLSEKYPLEVVPTGNGEFILMINPGEHSGLKEIDEIKDIIKNTQEYVLNTTQISFSAFISDRAANNKKLYTCYKNLNEVVRYRIMYSAGCILDKKTILPKEDHREYGYPEDQENNINKNLKAGNLDNTLRSFDLFFECIQKMDIDSFTMSLSRLAISIDKTVHLININRISEISIRFNEFYVSISNSETKGDIKDKFVAFFQIIIEQQKDVVKNRNSNMVESIVNFIEDNYSDKNLNLKEIAFKYKISYGYMLLIFKESKGQSLPEFLNYLRLNKSAELLRSTDDSILKIMELCGYDNESNFYRLFKKHYGTTPRDYRLNVMMSNKNT